MERALLLRTARTIRTVLARSGFRGGWVESVRRDGSRLVIEVRDGREHRFCFEGVVSASGLDVVGFVHGAHVVREPVGEDGRRTGAAPFRFSLIGEEALIEVVARSLRVEQPEESSTRGVALRGAT